MESSGLAVVEVSTKGLVVGFLTDLFIKIITLTIMNIILRVSTARPIRILMSWKNTPISTIVNSITQIIDIAKSAK